VGVSGAMRMPPILERTRDGVSDVPKRDSTFSPRRGGEGRGEGLREEGRAGGG
jgi:hypothetical protein